MGLRIVMEVGRNDIGRIAAGLEAAVADEVRKTCFDIEATAKMKAPVDTGALMNSITAESEGLTGTVSTNVDYATHQEYGTHKMAAHPYMTPAAEAAWPEFLAGIRKAVGG